MNLRVTVAMAVLLAVAAPATAAGPAAPDLVAGKVTITGDSFVIDDKTHQAVFSGHVVAIQAKMTLNADKVIAFYGNAGASSIKSFEATGHVKIVTQDQTATGERAVYDPKTRLLHLTGNVVVTGASGQVQGPELIVDLKKNTSAFSGGKSGGRVTGVFTSQ